MNQIKINRETLYNKIKIAHEKSFYNERKLPNLIAVSKQQATDKIIKALECGHRVFGENKVQEAEKKWLTLRDQYEKVELHLIGHLQTNKVKKAMRIFDFVHTLDRESLAYEIHKNIKNSRIKSFFVQVNTGMEEQKSGIFPNELEKFLNLCINKLDLPVIGLMCIPPIGDDPCIHFCYLNKLTKQFNLDKLSMGMSSDFEEAIKFGANYLRIGTEFFGKRDKL
jgi:pyridoxal phosphate enzyme (YggS family)